MEKNNIVLIGMPASGKSTVGVILAKILGMDFVDTDILIQKINGQRLNEIIDTQGVDAFLDIEEKDLLSLNISNTVIATGGRAIYSKKGMESLKKTSKAVYLKVSKQEIFARLKDIKERGVVLIDDQSMDDMYLERTKLYEKYAGRPALRVAVFSPLSIIATERSLLLRKKTLYLTRLQKNR